MELQCQRWHVEPFAVSSVRSNYFDNRSIFPAGSIEFDCALLMREIEHEWHGKSDLCCHPGAISSEPKVAAEEPT